MFGLPHILSQCPSTHGTRPSKVKQATPSLDLAQLRLGFYDQEAVIYSDSDRYLDLFHQMYRRFRIEDKSDHPRSTIEFTLLTNPDNPWGKPVILLDGEARFLNTSGLLEGYVYESVFHTIISRVKSHFLVHAGVVSYNDRGIILAADSGHGKTTLVLELVRRGFKFLSDEMAALARTDGTVEPFPRSLRIRPGTLERVGFPEASIEAPIWLDKLILDINEIKPNSLGARTSLNHVIILRNPAEPSGRSVAGFPRELGIRIDHLDEAFLAALREIEGVIDMQTQQDSGYPLITLRTMEGTSTLSKVEAICREHQVIVLGVIKRLEKPPRFDSLARLEKIAHSHGVMDLVQRFQGGHQAALLQEDFAGRSTRLFVELATLINQAKCYQLFVGSLSEMANLVCALVGATEK